MIKTLFCAQRSPTSENRLGSYALTLAGECPTSFLGWAADCVAALGRAQPTPENVSHTYTRAPARAHTYPYKTRFRLGRWAWLSGSRSVAAQPKVMRLGRLGILLKSLKK